METTTTRRNSGEIIWPEIHHPEEWRRLADIVHAVRQAVFRGSDGEPDPDAEGDHATMQEIFEILGEYGLGPIYASDLAAELIIDELKKIASVAELRDYARSDGVSLRQHESLVRTRLGKNYDPVAWNEAMDGICDEFGGDDGTED